MRPRTINEHYMAVPIDDYERMMQIIHSLMWSNRTEKAMDWREKNKSLYELWGRLNRPENGTPNKQICFWLPRKEEELRDLIR